MLGSLRQDLQFAIRTLIRRPAFTFVAVATLALGIGANTAIFSVVNAVLLRPLPLDEPRQLFAIGEQSTSNPGQVAVTSPHDLNQWRSSATAMRIAGFSTSTASVTAHGEPQAVTGTTTFGGLFSILGLHPELGRGLTADDEKPSAEPVVVLGAEIAKDLFGSPSAALRQLVSVNGVSRSVVGVMPPGYSFLGARSGFFVPGRYDAAFQQNRDQYYISAVARLNPGLTPARTRAELESFAARMRREYPEDNRDTRLIARPLADVVVGSARMQLAVLMGAVAAVLLIT